MLFFQTIKQQCIWMVIACAMSTILFTTPSISNAAPILATVAHYQIVDLNANSGENSNIVDISGGIKNYSYAPIRGHAIIYLLDNQQAVIHSVETAVNNNNSFGHGRVGQFKITVNVSSYSSLQSVSVEFVKGRM
ncbi:MAG: hypothetical protein U9R29_11060 [Thermodesulfobacteriota bacterium]|nr:hypothetical protein [Thermodesulfobacteriota bacterium]